MLLPLIQNRVWRTTSIYKHEAEKELSLWNARGSRLALHEEDYALEDKKTSLVYLKEPLGCSIEYDIVE